MQSSISKSCTTYTIHLKTIDCFWQTRVCFLFQSPMFTRCDCASWHAPEIEDPCESYEIFDESSQARCNLQSRYPTMACISSSLKSSRHLPWFGCLALLSTWRHSFSAVRLKRDFQISSTSCMWTHKHSRWDCQTNAKREQCWTTTPVTKQTVRLFAAHSHLVCVSSALFVDCTIIQCD